MAKHNITSKNGDKKHFDFIHLLYEKYVEWDDEAKSDQPLPGFLLSNKQLFWFVLIHKNCIKLQPGERRLHLFQALNVNNNFIGYQYGIAEFNEESTSEAYFKETKDFHRSFGCNFESLNMTTEDRRELIENYNEFY